MQGVPAEALTLYEDGLAVTRGDPALSDLRLMLQINKIAVLCNLGSYEEALAAADQARQHADQVGTTIRKAQAHAMLGQALFETGRWDDALAEASIVPESLKEPTVACDELAIAALIAFHRGDPATARNCLAAAAPHARRLSHRLVPRLALAHSLSHEQRGALPDALSALMDWLDDGTEELELLQDLYADAARLAMLTGTLDTAGAIARQAVESARQLQTPYRQANAMYCKGLLRQDVCLLLSASEHYRQATRPFHHAIALEAAAAAHDHAGDREQAHAALASAAEIYTWLGATVDAARVKAARETTRA
jgi:tetratricopeptide (TPR) repeat protein